MPRALHIVLAVTFSLMLTGCADPASMLAGGAKGHCKGSGTSPCTRPAPGNMDTTPPK